MTGSEDFKVYFSEDDSEAYVLTGPLPKLGLKEEPEPQDAPVYLNTDTGKGYYPDGVPAQEAADAVEYVKNQASIDAPVHLRQDTESWRDEFSELFGMAEPSEFWHVDLDEHDPYGDNV